MKFNKTLLLIFTALIMINIFSSCGSNKSYKDGDLIELYISENFSEFESQKDFHLLCLRFFHLTCATAAYGYNSDSIIKKVCDSLNIDKIYILCDNLGFKEISEASFDKEKFIFVYEEYKTLDAYAFPYMPHVFRIKNKKIKSLNIVNEKKKERRNQYQLSN